MNTAKFSYTHPLAYQRLLVASCAFMLACGLISMVAPRPAGASHHAFDELALPLPTAPPQTKAQPAAAPATAAPAAQAQPAAQLSQLPGSDGSATPATAPAATVAAVAPVAPVAPVTPTSSDDLRQLGRTLADIQFGDSQWSALNSLWTRESNWNPAAHNASGACGIPQALPCSKIADNTPTGQIQWGLNYIQRRYGTPTAAWQHEEDFGWY